MKKLNNYRTNIPKKNVIKLKSTVRTIFRQTFISVIILTSILGALGIYNYFAVGVYQNYDLLFTVGGFYSSMERTLIGVTVSPEETDELKSISNKLSRGCLSEKCKAFKIYSYIKTFKYEIGEDFLEPLDILEKKEGDCDETSNLIINLLASQKIESKLVCSTVHCWIVAELDGTKTKIDAVNGIYEEISDDNF